MKMKWFGGWEGETAPGTDKAVHRKVRWICPTDGLAAAFLIPVLVMIVIFIQRGIFPFGEESFLRSDMYHQYAPFFQEFKTKLSSGESLLYSWNVGMGVNFAALYAYYLASPLNWLVVLCPRQYILEFMTYSIVLKIGLSGWSFAYYLRKHCNTYHFGVAFFGIFYALSGYVAAYSWNIMWLDCIALLPLIVLGLERLVREKKGLLYCITLGMSILSNYYISIMICLFMVIYFLAQLILQPVQKLRVYLGQIFRFSFYSLLSGGLAAMVLLPEIFALQATASGSFKFPKKLESYFSIFDILARHIANVETEIGLDHWPNIYCGVAVLMMFLIYLVCRRIQVKEKIVYCGMLLIFYASFSMNVLNFIWHGFHFPNSLPCRQSFIYIFLILFMCYRAYMNLARIPWKHILAAFWASVCFVLLAEKMVDNEQFHFLVFYAAILYLSVYTGIIYLYKKKRVHKIIVLMLALTVVTVEASVNTAITSVTTVDREEYTSDNEAVRYLVEGIHEGSEFYRVEKTNNKTKNDGAWMNFPSISTFSSTANADLTSFFKKIGCESSTNAYSVNGRTPLINTLLSVKYSLYPSTQADGELQSLVDAEDGVYLYRNQYTLPVAYMLPEEFEEEWHLDYSNPADVQNNLCDLVGSDYVLEAVNGTVEDNVYRFTPLTEGYYYVAVINNKVEKVSADMGERSKKFDKVNRGFLLDLGYCYPGEEVILSGEEMSQVLEAKAYRFNTAALAQVYDKLNQMPLNVTKWEDTALEGTVQVRQKGVLFTSIPYDKGWTVTLDGEKQETKKIFDTFLSIDVPAGTHTVEFHYRPQGIVLGGSITGVSLLILAALIFCEWKKRRREQLWDLDEEEDDWEDYEDEEDQETMENPVEASIDYAEPEEKETVEKSEE